ncbi:MAG: SET domain-containing protein-lysine N-methyltransferase [Chloroflexota bacterium]|nr:SET domain-containing protein-lysine N-methyltransferase [Chloroflexota bacterium]
MPSSKYLRTTWYDPRAEIRPSFIQGNGMFASQPIHEGEIVVIIGGTVMTEEEFRVYILTVSRFNAVQIGEDNHLVDTPTASGGMNHSCDANLWMRDEVIVIARREIAANEELTQDYALYTTNPEWTLKPCYCRAPVCRKVVAGTDWQRTDVQEHYRDHFSPFINERIRRLSQH